MAKFHSVLIGAKTVLLILLNKEVNFETPSFMEGCQKDIPREAFPVYLDPRWYRKEQGRLPAFVAVFLSSVSLSFSLLTGLGFQLSPRLCSCLKIQN